jgi:Tfp pilus assembly protein PilN
MSQQINLYSPIFRKQTKVFSATTMLQGLALIVVVIAVFYYYMGAQSSLLELRAAQSAQQLKSELERLKVYGARESPAERVKALAQRKKELEAALGAQGQALEGLKAGGFGRSEGYSEMLRALARVSVEGVWLTRVEFSEDSGELSLAGRALRADLVPAYLARLRVDPSLRAQEFARLEVTRPAPTSPAAGSAPMPAFVDFTLSSGGEAPKAK